eukprot:TRINITY_DN29196_c0_g1_i1.p1 TRINITY_DN29196_c0_g1~~TRINITY_DN29196_c0_g1_i1.p1  ORF type:complete len:550 (-),score=74.00 TRINITY_DN29196_c0_g1_i1:77-1726(-)
MGLDPRLRRGLLEAGSESSSGCALLDEFEPCDDARRGCRDAPWAVAFCLLVVGVCHTAISYSGEVFEAATNARGHRQEDPVEAAEVYKTLLIAIFGAATASFCGGLLFLEVAKRNAPCLCWTALMMGPASLIITGMVMILSGTALNMMLGLCLFCLGVCYGSCVICCWSHLIPFTTLLIQTAVHVMRQHPFTIIISIVGAFLAVSWSLLCAFTCFGIYTVHSTDRGHSSRPDAPLYFIQCVVFMWGSMVAANTAQVACCGLFGRWYFGKDQGSPVSQSLKAALTTSFGSICFGSFIVAFIRALEFTLKQMRQSAQEEGNIVMCIVLCIIESLVACIGDIIEWFNEFAYVQCAVRGLGFLDSARATYALCTFSNCTMICADSLVSSVVVLGSVTISLLGTGTAWMLFKMFASDHPLRLALCTSLGFFVSFVTARATLQPLQSGVTAMVVCWAENPGGLARTRPELAREFAKRGSCWEDDVATASLRTSVDARTLQAVEMQSVPEGRQLAITVPPGVGPGETMQVTSPEGQLLQVQVPPGCGPGQQFFAAY